MIEGKERVKIVDVDLSEWGFDEEYRFADTEKGRLYSIKIIDGLALFVSITEYIFRIQLNNLNGSYFDIYHLIYFDELQKLYEVLAGKELTIKTK